MKWFFRFAFLLLCAASCFAQTPVTVTIGGTTYTGTLTAQGAPVVTPPATVPTATPQLPKVFMGGTAWALNQPATQYPVETRSLKTGPGLTLNAPIADTFLATFGPNHIVFDTSMRVTAVDTRKTPNIFAPVTLTTNWGSDNQVASTDPVTGAQVLTVPALPVVGCKIEGGAGADVSQDRHCLIYDVATGLTHELFGVSVDASGRYSAAAYRRWDNSKAQVGTPGQNSADAAGLPILPLLLRWAEANTGTIRHALRATINLSRANGNGGAFVAPASHASGNNWGSMAYMGQRFYLRQDFPMTGLAPIARTIVTCLKTYGIVVADNGMSGLITSDNDSHWDSNMLQGLNRSMTLADFVPVNSGVIIDATGAPVQ